MLKRIIFAILIIVNCMIIFNFSSQNSEKSNETSSVIVDKVVDTIANANKNIEKDAIKDNVTVVVRKLAHFSIYTLLGIWLMNEANTFDISKKKKYVICVLFGCLYAISDEFHQSFVSGRSQEIRDIVIDTCGVLFGCVLVMAVGMIIKKFMNKKGENV